MCCLGALILEYVNRPRAPSGDLGASVGQLRAFLKFRLKFYSIPLSPYPITQALRTHIVRLLGPKTVLYKAFGLFLEP